MCTISEVNNHTTIHQYNIHETTYITHTSYTYTHDKIEHTTYTTLQIGIENTKEEYI